MKVKTIIAKNVKFPAHRTGFTGKGLCNYIELLDPACKAGFAGALSVNQ